MRFFLFAVFLFFSFPTSAEDRLACEIRFEKVLEQAEEANQCDTADDCDYINLITCDGCVALPIHFGMKTRMEVAVMGFNNVCASSCPNKCAKPVEAKCVRNKCDFGLRDWKYRTKNPKSVMEK